MTIQEWARLALANKKLSLIVVFTILLSSCAVAPVQEVRLFNTAFITFNEASQPLFDDLAIAERRQGQTVAEANAKDNAFQGECAGIIWAKVGYIDGYCITDALYYSEIADPPTTRRIRDGIRLIGRYSEVLLTLAEGRNLDETSAQIQNLGGNIAALIAMGAGPGGGAAFSGALAALDPIIRDAAQRKNIEEMNRLVLAGAPHVTTLVVSLRDGAPAVFNTLIYQSVKGVTGADSLKNPAIAKSYLERISIYRIAVSTYVVLLGELQNTFDELVTAVQRPKNAASVAFVAEKSARLAVHADAWRRVYSSLRGSGS
jgi:hypothetical protein